MDLSHPDVHQSAQTAVLLLAPYLKDAASGAAKKAGEAAAGHLGSLLQLIRRQLMVAEESDDTYPMQTLRRLEEQPDNEKRQTTLAAVLGERVAADSEFGQDLANLVQRARTDSAVMQFVTNVSGQAQVERIINISATHVTFNEPRATVPRAAALEPPLDYQVQAVRQVIGHVRRSGVDRLSAADLDRLISDLTLRDGINPIFEPLTLRSVNEGLRHLLANGELHQHGGGPFEISANSGS
jgi:hypothetical protein